MRNEFVMQGFDWSGRREEGPHLLLGHPPVVQIGGGYGWSDKPGFDWSGRREESQHLILGTTPYIQRGGNRRHRRYKQGASFFGDLGKAFSRAGDILINTVGKVPIIGTPLSAVGHAYKLVSGGGRQRGGAYLNEFGELVTSSNRRPSQQRALEIMPVGVHSLGPMPGKIKGAGQKRQARRRKRRPY